MPLRPDLAERVQAFIDEHGEEALDRALGSGPLFGNLLAAGDIYWRSAMQLFDAGAPSTLIVQLDPRARRQAPKADVQVVLGQVELSFPIASARSA